MRFRRQFGLVMAALCVSATGCVERRFVITSDPPGAMVLDEKGLPLGPTPVDKQWVYNGKYRFTLLRDGFEPLVVEEQVAPRWFEYPGIDFFTENLIPYNFRDIRRFHYQMQPMQILPPEMVLQQGQALRSRGQMIGMPALGDPLVTPELPTMPPVAMPPPAP
jgi:hypothetical protein